MTDQQAITIASGLATFFDRKPWSAEKTRFFAQAIVDLDFETASKAAARYMRDGEWSPVPRDIRELANKIVPERKLLTLPHPDDEPPKVYYRDDEPAHIVRSTKAVRDRIQAQMDRDAKYTAKVLAARREAELKRNGGVESPLRRELNAVLERLRNRDGIPF